MSNHKKDKGLYICPNNHMYNANKYGDTCPNCRAKQADKIKTNEEYELELKKEPKDWVCGFLICIKGINKGNHYPFYSGKNFIGSDPNMDIYNKGDLSVQKKNHAVILCMTHFPEKANCWQAYPKAWFICYIVK